MSDFQIGTQYKDGSVYAGPQYGFVKPKQYQKLLAEGKLGRGQQTFNKGLKVIGNRFSNAYQTLPQNWRTKINGNGKGIWDGVQQIAKGAWDVQPQDHKDFATNALRVADAPAWAVTELSKKVDPTGRGISKDVVNTGEMLLPFLGGAKNIASKNAKKLLTKIDDLGTKALKNKNKLALAGDAIPTNGKSIPNGNGVNGAHKPLKMTVDEAGELYGKVRSKEIGANLTGVERSADPDLMRIGRLHQQDRVSDLTSRQKNAIASTAKGSDPVEYVEKYYTSRGLKAEAHHVLDHGFWGKALDSPNGQIAGEALWTKGVKSGNDSSNLVSAWSSKTKGIDHGTLHKLYNSIDERKTVIDMMDKGIWHKQKPEYQAKVLREIADRQFRLTANFYRMKLSAIKRNNPKLLKLSPQQLKEELFKNPQKYAEINPIKGYDLKSPDIVKAFNQQLNAIPHSGKVTKEMKVVFGLDIPKGGAKEWKGTANQKRFDLTIGPLTKRIARNKDKLTINK